MKPLMKVEEGEVEKVVQERALFPIQHTPSRRKGIPRKRTLSTSNEDD
jgi:hypothetical protein